MLITALTWALVAAPPVATLVLPTDGPDVLPAIRTGVDDAVRQVLSQRLGDALYSAENTEAILNDAVAAGLACSPKELSCATRIGIVAGAGEVLVPTVRRGKEQQLTISIIRVDVGRGAALGVAAGVGAADAGALVGVVDTLLALPATITVDASDVVGDIVVDGAVVGALPLTGPLAVSPGAHVLQVIGPRQEVVQQRQIVATTGHQHLRLEAAVPDELLVGTGQDSGSNGTPMLIAGAVTMGAGGLLILLGGGGAILTELELNTPNPDDSGVQGAREAGQLMVAVAAVGAVAFGVGGFMTMIRSDP